MASASCLCLAVLLALASAAAGQLSSTFYDTSCPNALSTIKSAVTTAVNNEPRMGASLLRMHFHDCFVDGCDASVLLNDTATFTGEQGAIPNKNSLRGFTVIDNIKAQVEAVCNQTVSCADILAVAARDSVVALFANKNLNVTDLVALSGGHTIGQAQCRFFRDHIYNDTNINSTFASSLQGNCPRASGSGDANLAPLDAPSPTTFNNDYFNSLLSQKGLLHSDQELFNGGSADSTVRSFASSASAFSSAFTAAMVKMGNISPKTGSQGQIRLSCSKVN
ncbi:unnamed protein product [Urochloa decumbens]|uniref:Plant heme peroxidase family profile domain-containing protein n=1 Tax=Urochloa decumbens TaxID=240449 RepID=A0ABC9FZB8_9POAL